MSTEGVALPADPRSDRSEVQLATVEQVIARVQQLCDTPSPEGGYPLATYVEGWFLGDITAITAAAIRSEVVPLR